MNVHLTPELEKLVHGKVRTGRYNSASEVVRLMEERDQLLALRKQEISKQIAQGIESLGRGEGIEGEQGFQQLDRRHRQVRRPRKIP